MPNGADSARQSYSLKKAEADASKLENSFAHSKTNAFNEVMDTLKNDPAALNKVGKELKSSKASDLASTLGINVSVERNKSGEVTGFDFSQHHSSGLWGDICGAVDSVKHTVVRGYDDTKHAAKDVAHDITKHPMEVALDATGVGAVVDGVAHLTGTSKALDQMLRGAENEVVHHPLTVLKDAAIGAGVTALTVATGGIGTAALVAGAAGYEVATKGVKGAIDGAINDGKGMADTVTKGYDAIGVVDDPSNYTKSQVRAATQSLNQVGDVALQMAAGMSGGAAGAALGGLADGIITGAAGDASAAGTEASTVGVDAVKLSDGSNAASLSSRLTESDDGYEYEVKGAEHINSVAKDVSNIAKETNKIVRFNFSGKEVTAAPGDPAQFIKGSFYHQLASSKDADGAEIAGGSNDSSLASNLSSSDKAYDYTPKPAESIEQTAKNVAKLAKETNKNVTFKFNGVEINAGPRDSADQIEGEYTYKFYSSAHVAHLLAATEKAKMP